MFTPGTSIPKLGEIRLGYVEQGTPSPTHKYVGLHPYLVISNKQGIYKIPLYTIVTTASPVSAR